MGSSDICSPSQSCWEQLATYCYCFSTTTGSYISLSGHILMSGDAAREESGEELLLMLLLESYEVSCHHHVTRVKGPPAESSEGVPSSRWSFGGGRLLSLFLPFSAGRQLATGALSFLIVVIQLWFLSKSGPWWCTSCDMVLPQVAIMTLSSCVHLSATFLPAIVLSFFMHGFMVIQRA